MKAYVIYDMTRKEIKMPDKFANLFEKGGCWSEEIKTLWQDLDEYMDSKAFLGQCDFNSEICALEDENGYSILMW